MNKFSFKKQLLAVALGALSLAAVPASAAPTFTYDFDGVAGGTTVVANSLSGTSSEFLTIIDADSFAGSGWVQFTSLNFNSAAILSPATTYTATGLYAKFTLQADLFSGTLGAANSLYNVSALTFALFYDPTRNNVFTQSSAAGLGTPSTVTDTGANDIALGGGALAAIGLAVLAPSGGTAILTTTTMSLTAAGSNFFIDPNPFYIYALQGFSSTGGAFQFNPDTGNLATNNATGIVDFIPEPGTLLLFGLALAGLGFSSRRKQ